ncbi:hypothetical protein PR001_g27766 [Phytophthora rubi]|uniref:Myb/SANT-like domain-containing protein n=1 Tax=Phytophthora rubi TaxID=129364 RepID=A0A6A3HH17_9STRA|nr:hypothetical protein PR001_g27766 [Phytophthora rubi]
MPFVWTPELTARFINAVLDQVVRLGAAYEGNFKKAVWNRIVSAFNDGLPDATCRDRKQLQSKIADLKKKYKAFTAMKNNSGFGWDPSTDMPTAPDAVWDDVIAAHPQAREFKTRPLFMYAELDRILSRTVATGSYAAYVSQPGTSRPQPRSAPSSLSEVSSDSERDEAYEVTAACTTTTTTASPLHRSNRRASLDAESKIEEDTPSQQRRTPRRQQRGDDSDASTPTKRQKTTGDKMSDALQKMAALRIRLRVRFANAITEVGN